MKDVTPDYVKPTMTVEEALEVVLNYCKKKYSRKKHVSFSYCNARRP